MMWALVLWNLDPYTGKIYPSLFGCYTTNMLLPSSALTQGYAGFNDWLAQPSMPMWKAAVSRAPSVTTAPPWGIWIASETWAYPPESPTSYSFIYQCEGPSNWYWTSTQESSSTYDIVSLLRDAFMTSGSPGGLYNINYPVRTLAAGEQYFWYQ